MMARFEAVVADVAGVADIATASVVAVVCEVERIKEVKFMGSFVIGTKAIFSVFVYETSGPFDGFSKID